MRNSTSSTDPGIEAESAGERTGGPGPKYLVAGTAGHIDHGKTALVRTLTGIDPDRLKEEKERGITIDLGFADMDLGSNTHLAFVDVPGHERFVKNMLAGAGGIDLVLLVVAADESIRQQTREHFAICRLLGIERGLVAITKTDLVDGEIADLVRLELGEFLRGTFLESAPILPVSSRTGEGIPELVEAFRRIAAETPPRNAAGTARLPVDRSFSMRGFGTVVTGTLLGGRLRVGQDVGILPSDRVARIRGLQVHGRTVEAARAGQRTAVNLHGVEVAQVQRGNLLAPAGLFVPGHLFDLRLELLSTAAAPLKNLQRVRFHHGTTEVMGRVKLLERSDLAPGSSGFAQIRLERPVVALHGDRFILRRYSPPTTIGGGRILDNRPVKHKGFPAAVRRHLERMDSPAARDLLLEFVVSLPPGDATAAAVCRLTGWGEGKIEGRLADLTRAGSLRRVETRPACYLLPERYEEIGASVVALLQRFHAGQPLSIGLSREEIRTRLFSASPPEFFRHFLADLVEQRRIRQEKDLLCLFDHRVTLAGDDAGLESRLESEFRKGSLSPPTLRDLVGRLGLDAGKAEKIFFLLLQRGKLVRLDGGMVFHREALEGLKASLWRYREGSDRINVGAFKALTGTTRKSAIPLLEHLDRIRVTRREGNVRVILPRP